MESAFRELYLIISPYNGHVRTPTGILDEENHIITALAGGPNNGDWESAMAGVEKAFIRAREKGYQQGVFTPGNLNARRGNFPKLFSAISFGTGQKVWPSALPPLLEAN
jgi:hypothetical protein